VHLVPLSRHGLFIEISPAPKAFCRCACHHAQEVFLTEAKHMQALRHPHIVSQFRNGFHRAQRGAQSRANASKHSRHTLLPRCPLLQVTFYGCVLDGPKGILLMELMDGRDLGSALRLRNARGQRTFGWYQHGCRIAWEISKALNHLHARNLVHMVRVHRAGFLGCRDVLCSAAWGIELTVCMFDPADALLGQLPDHYLWHKAFLPLLRRM